MYDFENFWSYIKLTLRIVFRKLVHKYRTSINQTPKLPSKLNYLIVLRALKLHVLFDLNVY